MNRVINVSHYTEPKRKGHLKALGVADSRPGCAEVGWKDRSKGCTDSLVAAVNSELPRYKTPTRQLSSATASAEQGH